MLDNRTTAGKGNKEFIIRKLRENGCRITKQRQLILDIILQNDCSCCKEIYYKASKLDHSIGTATVYRFLNTLEGIGAIDRKNMYKVLLPEKQEDKNFCTYTLEDQTVFHFSEQRWNEVIQAGLLSLGYLDGQKGVGR